MLMGAKGSYCLVKMNDIPTTTTLVFLYMEL